MREIYGTKRNSGLLTNFPSLEGSGTWTNTELSLPIQALRKIAYFLQSSRTLTNTKPSLSFSMQTPGLGKISSSPPLYSLWDLRIFRSFLLLQTQPVFARCKASLFKLSPLYRHWDLEKFPAFPWALGLGQILSSPPLRRPWEFQENSGFPSSFKHRLQAKVET